MWVFLSVVNVQQFAQEVGDHMCLSGQGSEVHWNLLRNLFVKTIVNYCIFLQKYILENCILSIKVFLCKLAQALVFCCDLKTSLAYEAHCQSARERRITLIAQGPLC